MWATRRSVSCSARHVLTRTDCLTHMQRASCIPSGDVVETQLARGQAPDCNCPAAATLQAECSSLRLENERLGSCVVTARREAEAQAAEAAAAAHMQLLVGFATRVPGHPCHPCLHYTLHLDPPHLVRCHPDGALCCGTAPFRSCSDRWRLLSREEASCPSFAAAHTLLRTACSGRFGSMAGCWVLKPVAGRRRR